MHALEETFGPAPHRLVEALQANHPVAPLSAKIKLTWRCNQRCPMCSVWRVQGLPAPRPDRLAPPRLNRLIDHLAGLGCRKVHLSGGEPLLYPELIPLVARAASRGLRVRMTSNGVLWQGDRAAQLLAAGLSGVTFSIDGLDAETYRRSRGRDDWERALQGIRSVQKAVELLGVPCKRRANTVVNRFNYRSLTRLPDLAASLGLKAIRLLPVDDFRLPPEQRMRLNPEQIREFNEEVAPAIREQATVNGIQVVPEGAMPFGHTPEEIAASAEGYYALGLYRNHYCFAPWTHVVVAPDALVYPCCLLKGEKLPVGDLTRDDFETIWLGERYAALRRALLQSPHPVCHRCDEYLPENRYLNELLPPEARRRSTGPPSEPPFVLEGAAQTEAERTGPPRSARPARPGESSR